MKLNLDQIAVFNKCPAYYWFSKNTLKAPINIRHKIIIKVMQKCYIYLTRTYKVPAWKRVLNWIDKEAFKYINIKEENAYEKAKSFIQSLIIPINSWFFDFFKSNIQEGYVNIPIQEIIGGVEIHATLPILKLSDPISIINIGNEITTKIQLSNNFYLKALASIVAKQFKIDLVELEYFYIGNESLLKHIDLRCVPKINQRTENFLTQITTAIRNRVCYPSITEMCLTCPFNKECSL